MVEILVPFVGDDNSRRCSCPLSSFCLFGQNLPRNFYFVCLFRTGFPYLLFAELMLYLLLVVYARMEIHLGGLACIPFYVGTDKTLFSSSFAHD